MDELRVHLNSVCNLESFSDPGLRSVLREVYPHELVRFGPDYPTGHEYRKDWEVGMAVAALREGGALRPDAEILGIGAGYEPTICHLTRLVRRVFATDLYLGNEHWDESAHVSMLHDPGEHWVGEWNPRRLVVQHMNALELCYEDESFDGVFSSSSIEHFGSAAEVTRSLDEMFRVLKPGGVLSLSTEFRLAGPGPGIAGVLMFDEPQIRELFLDPYDWSPIDPVDLSCSEATLATEQVFGDLLGDLRAHLEGRRFIRFDQLEWSRYPHLVLRDGDRVWTSVHLALRKADDTRRAGPSAVREPQES